MTGSIAFAVTDRLQTDCMTRWALVPGRPTAACRPSHWAMHGSRSGTGARTGRIARGRTGDRRPGSGSSGRSSKRSSPRKSAPRAWPLKTLAQYRQARQAGRGARKAHARLGGIVDRLNSGRRSDRRAMPHCRPSQEKSQAGALASIVKGTPMPHSPSARSASLTRPRPDRPRTGRTLMQADRKSRSSGAVLQRPGRRSRCVPPWRHRHKTGQRGISVPPTSTPERMNSRAGSVRLTGRVSGGLLADLSVLMRVHLRKVAVSSRAQSRHHRRQQFGESGRRRRLEGATSGRPFAVA